MVSVYCTQEPKFGISVTILKIIGNIKLRISLSPWLLGILLGNHLGNHLGILLGNQSPISAREKQLCIWYILTLVIFVVKYDIVKISLKQLKDRNQLYFSFQQRFLLCQCELLFMKQILTQRRYLTVFLFRKILSEFLTD